MTANATNSEFIQPFERTGNNTSEPGAQARFANGCPNGVSNFTADLLGAGAVPVAVSANVDVAFRVNQTTVIGSFIGHSRQFSG
jgi:hypothetical protein